MTAHTIELPEEQVRFIRDAIAAGRFHNESEVVQTALRLLERDEEEYRANLEELRAEVQKGMDDIEAGRYIELNSKEEISAYFDTVRAQRHQHLAREDDGAQA